MIKTYKNRFNNTILVRNKETLPDGAITYTLYPQDSSRAVGFIRFNLNRAQSELFVFRINVYGHRNEANAQNRSQGVGRLLMYMACKHAEKRGARTIRLVSERSAIGFYLPMGLHRSQVQSLPHFSGERSVNSSLQTTWLDTFNDHFREIRRGGMMVSELKYVLLNIEGRILLQWEEEHTRRFSSPSCVIA